MKMKNCLIALRPKMGEGLFGVNSQIWHQIRQHFSLLPVVFLAIFLAGCAGHVEDSTGIKNPGGAKLVVLDDSICQNTKNGKMWLMKKSKRIGSLEDAKKYSSSLKNGGYDDWRLPTVSELFDLYMTFDLHLNGSCDLQVEGTYWSDEPDFQGRVGAWELDDNCDPERRYIPKKKGYVRAIR